MEFVTDAVTTGVVTAGETFGAAAAATCDDCAYTLDVEVTPVKRLVLIVRAWSRPSGNVCSDSLFLMLALVTRISGSAKPVCGETSACVETDTAAVGLLLAACADVCVGAGR